MQQTDGQREIWLDWLRVTACFLVMATHITGNRVLLRKWGGKVGRYLS